ncbi:hypothetical protein P5G60_18415 [Paenibacillus jamilae]|nr:hypothetical protein [Paenibacillus jamilae]
MYTKLRLASTPNLRKVVTEKIAKLRSRTKKISDDILMGRIFKEYIVYIGSEDNIDSAQEIIDDVRLKYPNHAMNKLTKPGQPTNLQKMINSRL